MLIIPGINTDQPKLVQQSLDTFAQLEPQPERIQLDILDGEFATELTVEPNLLHDLQLPDLTIDLHLMTLEPIDYVSEVRGIRQVQTIIAQIERMHSQAEFLDEVQANYFEAGLALELYTPFESIDQNLLPQLHVIQVLAGKTGFSGQSFNDIVLPKIREIRQAKEDLQLECQIYVDIGMNPATLPVVQQAGADGAVVVSYLQRPDCQQAWEDLREGNV